MVQVLMITAGQRNGVLPAAVMSCADRGNLLHFQYVQQTTEMCTTLNYCVFTGNVTLELYPEALCSTFSNKMLLYYVVHQSCPPGFRTGV